MRMLKLVLVADPDAFRTAGPPLIALVPPLGSEVTGVVSVPVGTVGSTRPAETDVITSAVPVPIANPRPLRLAITLPVRPCVETRMPSSSKVLLEVGGNVTPAAGTCCGAADVAFGV